MEVLELYSAAGRADKMASRGNPRPFNQRQRSIRPAPLLQQVHAQVTYSTYVEEDLEMAARFGDSDSREERSEFSVP